MVCLKGYQTSAFGDGDFFMYCHYMSNGRKAWSEVQIVEQVFYLIIDIS